MLSINQKLALRAGFHYYLLVLVVGFIFGTMRVLYITPLVGELRALALEIPCILTGSWLILGMLLKRPNFSHNFKHLALMGFSAWFFLMLTEYLMSRYIFMQTSAPPLTAFWTKLHTLPGALGLGSQLIFGLLPLFKRQNPNSNFATITPVF